MIEAGIFALGAVQQALAWVAGDLLKDGLTGIIGNRADDVAWWATKRGWRALQQLRTSDPKLNHDLQRALRKSYLLATHELVRQAQQRLRVQSGASRVLAVDSERNSEALTHRVRRAIEAELDSLEKALPEMSTADADLLVLDESSAPQDRLRHMRASQKDLLQRDMARWLRDENESWLPVIDHLIDHGWIIQLESGESVQREWHQLISLAFVEELKTEERLRAVFESRILAELKNRDERLAPVSNFAGFQEAFDRVVPPLQRIEKGLAAIQSDVSEIRDSVRSIDRKLESHSAGIPRWVWAAAGAGIVGLVITAVLLQPDKPVPRPPVDVGRSGSQGSIEVKTGDKSPAVVNSRTGELVIQYGAQEPGKQTNGDSR